MQPVLPHVTLPRSRASPPRQAIPRVIRQTHAWPFAALPPRMAAAAQRWIDLNPEWTHEYYDQRAMDAYAAREGESHFPGFAAAYNKTIPVGKADLWRTLITFLEGGLYADADVLPLRPLRELVRTDDDGVSGVGTPDLLGLDQFLLCYAPHHPIMERAVQVAVRNVLTRQLWQQQGWGIWETTGPRALHRAVTQVLGVPRCGGNRYPELLRPSRPGLHMALPTLRCRLFRPPGPRLCSRRCRTISPSRRPATPFSLTRRPARGTCASCRAPPLGSHAVVTAVARLRTRVPSRQAAPSRVQGTPDHASQLTASLHAGNYSCAPGTPRKACKPPDLNSFGGSVVTKYPEYEAEQEAMGRHSYRAGGHGLTRSHCSDLPDARLRAACNRKRSGKKQRVQGS